MRLRLRDVVRGVRFLVRLSHVPGEEEKEIERHATMEGHLARARRDCPVLSRMQMLAKLQMSRQVHQNCHAPNRIQIAGSGPSYGGETAQRGMWRRINGKRSCCVDLSTYASLLI